ncbi:MAG TPA: hypothetical protein VMZ30_11440 [Pyrinomonadaceae bacterium]|nr:hypothetical protein [Pyrinomonadaceae bacterium]
MKVFILNRTLLILVCFGVCCVSLSAQTASNGPLTNQAVVKLVKANFKEKTIISIIGSRATRFDLSTERMIDLKRSGVSERIILAMLARQQGFDFDDSWNDEAFFSQGNDAQNIDKQGGPAGNSAPDNSTDIFGSSGGFHGSTRSKGGNSASGGDTITTGSATVRILRPPAEAGAVPKLEKVATLTNDSIVELIEAGFSEGTIIRRIERSPVEFDLSPEKLAELRRHRVSEKILSAMKTATGETSETRSQPTFNGTPRR